MPISSGFPENTTMTKMLETLENGKHDYSLITIILARSSKIMKCGLRHGR